MHWEPNGNNKKFNTFAFPKNKIGPLKFAHLIGCHEFLCQPLFFAWFWPSLMLGAQTMELIYKYEKKWDKIKHNLPKLKINIVKVWVSG